MEALGTELKHSKWKKLIQVRLGITETDKVGFELDKLIKFVGLLEEVEEENLKLNRKIK